MILPVTAIALVTTRVTASLGVMLGLADAPDAVIGSLSAPMPGKVIAVDVAEGQAVTAGQRLMVLEAMKMEHALTAPFDGVVEGLTVSAGAQVQVDAVLAKVVPAASE